MTWVRLDENFATHPKLLAAGPLGLALHVAALCYCNRHMTDGFVPRPAAATLLDFTGLGMRMWDGDMMGGGEDAEWGLVVEDLVEAGLWEPAEDGWKIHDYLDYQLSKEHLRSISEVRSKAGRKGGKTVTRNGDRNGGRNATVTDDVTGAERQRRYRERQKALRHAPRSDGKALLPNEKNGVTGLEANSPANNQAKSKPVPVPVKKEEEESAAAPTTEPSTARDKPEPTDDAAAELSIETEPIELTSPGSSLLEPDPPSPAVEVIAAFDDARREVFGDAQARPFPRPRDLPEAKAMLDGGADLDTCRHVFRAVFERQKSAGAQPADSLSYMRNPIADARMPGIPPQFRRRANGFSDPKDGQEDARVESWRRAAAEGREPVWLGHFGDREEKFREYDARHAEQSEASG